MLLLLLLLPLGLQAQIKIGGSVYGGGNVGNVRGNTSVTVKAGDIDKVYGGARMADVGGSAYVNIDGEHATGYTVINYVYGGNDIAGTIGTRRAVGEALPAELTGNADGVDDTWNTYVHLSTKTASDAVHYTQDECDAYNTENGLNEGDEGYRTTADIKTPAVVPEKTYIGQLFGGGNGDYYYETTLLSDEVTCLHEVYQSEGAAEPIATKVTSAGDAGFAEPRLEKTYVDIQGGSIVYAYGGGNKVTVTEETVIHVDNPSAVVNHILVDDDGNEADSEAYEAYEANETYHDLLTAARFRDDMGINTGFSHPSSDEFQIGRLFGGNNLVEMSIMPKWNLQSGKVRNLYSGGNKGAMTCPDGLLLEIPATSSIIVDNLFGGCRMADVHPMRDGISVTTTNEALNTALGGSYKFPDELSARVLVRGGNINNVYGGNDITGRVWGGSAVGIYHSIRGNVYGGGNGNYPYTDNPGLQGDDIYGDVYYGAYDDGASSVTALNAYRPNAEQVSIRLAGTSASEPTVIAGSVYLGGNCATLKAVKRNPLVELKMGSHAIADKVFLGNNGEGMATDEVLRHYAYGVDSDGNLDESRHDFSQMHLTDASQMASYMEGVAMDIVPGLTFDAEPRDPATYEDYSSYIGSFFCGGNVGSMTYEGLNQMQFNRKVIVYDKVVGGCNNADVAASGLNAAYEGGIRGTATEREEGGYMEGGNIKNRLELNFNGPKIQPMRLYSTAYVAVADGTVLTEGETYYTTDAGAGEFVAEGTETADGTNYFAEERTLLPALEWNTAKWKAASYGFIETGTDVTADDAARRLIGGNVYGGCYNSGHVNGNVVININQDLIDRYGEYGVFADVGDDGEIDAGGERRSGVILDRQGDDVMSVAMTVFGGGCGEETEIWGSTTVNLNSGYAFQIFGGGEEGVVGKRTTNEENGEEEYVYNAAYSTTVNLNGTVTATDTDNDGTVTSLAEAEYIYGGGNEGDVCGNTLVNLGNGRIFDAFGGASNADILGAAEVYIGRQPDGSGDYKYGFPWIRDNVYGGNDFGGTIKGTIGHAVGRIPFDASLLESATFVKYIQGRVDSIFGGNYGNYDYTDDIFCDYTDEGGNPINGFSFPHLDDNSFVHLQPTDNDGNAVGIVFGGSEGTPGNVGMNNLMQEESYVLVDDTESRDETRFARTDIYGGGAFAGVGTASATGAGRTIVDLYAGRFNNIYGGSDQEGLIGYTRVNVPAASTVKVNAIFGGSKGYDATAVEANPALAARYCDIYVTCVDYQSASAIVDDAIYGGNCNSRVAFDTYLNIGAPVNQSSGYQATVYGAGYGEETVSGRTNVYMNDGSNAYKVFGGGRDGNVYNFESLKQWLGLQYAQEAGTSTPAEIAAKVKTYGTYLQGFRSYISSHPVTLPSPMPAYSDNLWTIEDESMVDTWTYHNTNVHIMPGGNVSGYAYGGGFGEDAVVAGSTYIELKGGTVQKDVYGGGQGGPVMDEYGLGTFTATTNANIESGMVRNVYGGGYLGHVGKHDGDISTPYDGDFPAVANVTIGKADGTGFADGIPAIQRNAYGGGEGGSVYGTANVTLNNGYIGYSYRNTGTAESTVYEYAEQLEDSGYATPNTKLADAGNVFGGGYVINSYVDKTNVEMYGGTVRGSLYGGGEVGPIGRGTVRDVASYDTGLMNGNARIFKAGKTSVRLYDGWVKRNVFGGGRGLDNWGGDGTMFMDEDLVATLDLVCKGYVFGQTEVDVYGGEIGTDEGVARGYGNVFGGGDIGFVYSAYELPDGTLCIGRKDGVRYDDNSEGYYYKHNGTAFVDDAGTALGEGAEKHLTEDCKVLVEPWCKATSSVTIHDKTFAAGEYVPTAYLNYLGNKSDEAWASLSKTDPNENGILIHNAVFAGGNTSPGSTIVYASTTTVYGNATASIHDVFHRDLVTVGTGRTGGLYGDGNLTLVDGYRELNITNYGTDYYSIKSEITYDEYEALPDREAAYYEIRYRCLTACRDKDGKTYTPGSTITADELRTVFEDLQVNSLTQVMDEDDNPVFDANGYPVTTTDGTRVDMLDANGDPLPLYWTINGVCSRYAGRVMNTIQRADFCGVFGSRMVMQGAQDRVPTVVDYTNYTINRVREVSLNRNHSVRGSDLSIESGSPNYYRLREHGNYFGIYSVVNHLGALTSDVDFSEAIRTTDSDNHEVNDPDLDPTGATITATEDALAELAANPIDGVTVSGSTVTASTVEALYRLRSVSGVDITASPLTDQTYYEWKALHHDERKRNNGSSPNKVALASGVYLELTTEKGTGDGLYEKDWGYITGVVELDLISVQQGLGGGFVYAKNVHGVRSETGLTHTILTALNTGAVTRKMFSYATEDANKEEWQTSGNFVHSSQTIIDDCYNIGARYLGDVDPDGSGAMPAHYWFIKGLVYVYDQYISAYTGASNAYSEVVDIPLTISSAAHGKMTLLDVKPNRYAYYTDFTRTSKLSTTGEIVLRDVTYKLNDPISYWDYYMLSADEKRMFVEKTYVTTDSCKIGDDYYPSGYVMLPEEYEELLDAAELHDFTPDNLTDADVPAVQKATRDADGNPAVATDDEGHPVYKAFADVFHESNNLSHDTGYILTYKVNNPAQWDVWYTEASSATYEKNRTGGTGYEDGPTYTPSETGLYGQQEYSVGNIISQDIYDTYQDIVRDHPAVIPETGQAMFEPAYIVTADILEAINIRGAEQRFYRDATLGKSDYTDSQWAAMSGSVAEAYVVTSTIQLSNTEYIYRGTYLTEADKTTLYNTYHDDGTEVGEAIAADIDRYIVPAYYCYAVGKYGGGYYEEGHSYRGLAAYSSMSEEDRAHFTFNYDAFDLLIDPAYRRAEGMKYQYDGQGFTTPEEAATNPAQYSLPTPIDYEATYKGTSLSYTYQGKEKTIVTNDVILRDEYESLLNERYYYSAISVTSAGEENPYYVVMKSMFIGDTPYAAGEVIEGSVYEGLSDDAQNDIKTLYFDTPNTTYYFCRESYSVAEAADGGMAVTDVMDDHTYGSGATVPIGTVITKADFEALTNNQANFVIHGLAPTETSMLLVPRNSDINDLSTEKIITVVYQYDYVETDMAGMNIVPVSERHVLNIHLQFKSGVPAVEEIQKPDIVLPGTTISIKEPFVTPGAYEVTGGGWELFDGAADAESHINGMEYIPNLNPLFLYQNQYFVAYYAKTYLGKTYSNAVPVTVANYHDLKKVMDATAHHYYIDHKDVIERDKVEPKIYINDYSGSGENGLDLLKSLYDLSVLDGSPVENLDEDGLIQTGDFTGHAPLNDRVAGGNNLEFFLRADIDRTVPSGSPVWTPIAPVDGSTPCFQGTFHGDGHTLSGLEASLFGKLCGKVYNLGVTGSFTSAGVADYGDGYVENCWVNTTGEPNGSVYAVFGEPSRSVDEEPIQIVNSYCQEGKTYKTDATTHGMATPRPDRAFYNGEVAYDLNGFYLYKRYCDEKVTSGTEGQSYQFYTIGEDNKPVLQPAKYYGSNPEYCSSGFMPTTPLEGYVVPMYVEDRFADGDFRYAAGTIPTVADERLYVDTEDDNAQYFFPIWPDDYIFFGQKLTYGYGLRSHQDVPTAVARSDGRLSQVDDANRVYRAPAYFRSKQMGVAHFNPNAYLAQKSADGTREAYPGMTAIDFRGHNDNTWHLATVSGGYPAGSPAGLRAFYPPLLDDDGLLGIRNCDETRNLLAYAPSSEQNSQTLGVLSGYFTEPAYDDYYDNSDGYRIVGEAPVSTIYGHLVQHDLTTTGDHLLVDKQDFNCPISYDFGSGKRMWYQRVPDTYVDFSKGWEGVSLPFTAELVTTHQKGEITHFYSGSNESANGTGSKTGHEYWLRQFNDIALSGSPTEATASFTYPGTAGDGSSVATKSVSNTFLWDYYYSQSLRRDANADIYQQYYRSSRTFNGYSFLTKAKPYLIGFPGDTYYEFDLSGSFVPQNTYSRIADLETQTVTFASEPAVTVGVSDDELTGVVKTLSDSKDYTFTFQPSYMSQSLEAGTDNYVLNAAGDSYDKVPDTGDATRVSAFRPYFSASVSGGAKEYRTPVRSIAFSRETAQMYEQDDDISGMGSLHIRAGQGKILVSSTLTQPTTVTIVSATGALTDRYAIQPGETRETTIGASGVYIVNKKKLSVKVK